MVELVMALVAVVVSLGAASSLSIDRVVVVSCRVVVEVGVV